MSRQRGPRRRLYRLLYRVIASGVGQKHAFEDAVAQVGCPDRRIDRRCITCCSPSNRYVTGYPALRCECDRFSVALSRGYHGPRRACNLVGERNRSNFGRSTGQQLREPRPIHCAMDLGVADHSERAGCEQAASIAIAFLTRTAKLVLAPARVLFGTSPT